MSKIFLAGFIVFAAVFSGLLFAEAVGGLISGIFPITLWLLLVVIFGVAATATFPKRAAITGAVSWPVIVLSIWYTLLLVGYFALYAWRYGPFAILLVLVVAALPVIAWKMVKNFEE